MAQELGAETELRTLLERVLRRAVELTASTGASVYLHDERRRKLYVAHAVGPGADVVLRMWGIHGKGIPLVGSKAGAVFTSGDALVENEVQGDAEHFKEVDHDTATATRSMCCVPLNVAGRRIGAVQLLNRIDGPYSSYELALLEAFAGLAAVAVRNARLIRELAAHMGAYGAEIDALDAGAIERLLTTPAAAERLSTLFVDLRSYSHLERVLREPVVLQAKLNEYLDLIADCAMQHAGIVNKFLGDGAMLIFRGAEHEWNAVRCADAIVHRFDELKARWDADFNESLDFLDVGIGIATDTVTLGTIGSERVREFTAIGPAVGLAAFLVDRARAGRRILTDRMTFKAVADRVVVSATPEQVELTKAGPGGPVYEIHTIAGLREMPPAGDTPLPREQPGDARPAQRNPSLFVSYSRADAAWLQELQIHLRPFMRRRGLSLWDDTRIAAGTSWRTEIEVALADCAAAILLVTPRYLSSEFVERHELPPLLDAARRRGLRIFWIPVSASAFEETELANFQATVDPRAPLDGLSPAERNATWVRICRDMASTLRLTEA